MVFCELWRSVIDCFSASCLLSSILKTIQLQLFNLTKILRSLHCTNWLADD